jgi:hypothetical protein
MVAKCSVIEPADVDAGTELIEGVGTLANTEVRDSLDDVDLVSTDRFVGRSRSKRSHPNAFATARRPAHHSIRDANGYLGSPAQLESSGLHIA